MLKNKTPLNDVTSQATPIHLSHLLEITDQFDSFFFDMYGLLWDGSDFYPHVFPLLENLRAQDKKVYILSNVTALREKFIQQKAAKGFIYQKQYDEVITSGDVCAAAILKGLFEKMTGKTDYQVATIGKYNAEMFAPIDKHATSDIEIADVVYLSGVQIDKAYETIDHLIPSLKQALMHNLPAVCANPDLTFMEKDKQLPTQGALAHWYETHGGYVHYFGKPYSNIYEYAFQLTKQTGARALMAGDTLSTDILGGKNAGMKTLLVTQTGLTGHHLRQGETLEQLFKKEKVTPDFTMDMLTGNSSLKS